ncbi:MAG: hypothetical protein NDJ72_03720 [Elusimicrobia bacterium]|nr:hypothetical protein [Elusimicrobiota bacterium]
MSGGLAALERLNSFDFAGAAAALGPRRPALGLFADPLQDLRYRARGDAGLAAGLGRAERLSRRRPRDARLRQLVAALRIARGDYRRGLAGLPATGGALQRHWSLLWEFRARSLWGLERRDAALLGAAESAIDAALELEPDSAAALFWRADYHANFGRYLVALPDLHRLVDRGENLAWALSLRGEVYTELRLWELVRADYEALARLSGGAAWAVALRGRAHAKFGRLEEGLADLDAAVASARRGGDPRTFVSAVAWRGEARRKRGGLAAALRDFDAALAGPVPYPLAEAWKGRALLGAGRLEEARAALGRSLPRLKAVDASLALCWRAEASARLGDFRAALADFGKVYPLSPKDTWTAPPERMRRQARAAAKPGDADAWTFLGRLSLDAGDNEGAAEQLSRAAALAPARPWVRTWLGLALLRSGRPGPALDELERAGEGAWARAHRGRSLAELGDLKRGLRELDAAVDASGSGWPLLWRAQARLRAGDAAGSAADARGALARETRAAEMYAALARAERALGRRAKALAAFAEAVALDPSMRWRTSRAGAPTQAPRLAAVAWALGDRAQESFLVRLLEADA